MIYKLRRKMIWICGVSVTVVFVLIYMIIAIVGTNMMDDTVDMMADRISDGNGLFRPFDRDNPMPPGMNSFPYFFTDETPFSTRFFTVWLSDDGKIADANLDAVSYITEEDAYEYAEKALDNKDERGWLDNYRYKIFDSPMGKGIVFVDGSVNRATTRALLITAAVVLLGALAAIFAVIVILSKRVVRPIARSYEKQRQFVTDANHELKTPLTLILTNLDIVEQELGHSEWLDDIRAESKRMSGLVSQLTSLSRLDEDGVSVNKTRFSLSEVCEDTISDFENLIKSKKIKVMAEIQPEVTFFGDEGLIRRLVTILIDNAVKYCDARGGIIVSLAQKRQIHLAVENSFHGVDDLELAKLFDRFYRADPARTAGSSFGIGLSIAKSIAEKHNGNIKAYKAGHGRIGFRVTLKR